ncbi:hypothetical protein PS870_00498 [Pseudomonas fluorescens]|uniref:Phage tail protein n=1 Tax=Pseudomonas fluorescens TaxID=294 RepID=A0A5E7GUC9_PSEFL|nr:tail fiber assembly protein [Pseudomonas fluorescens]VVO55170.1 hypothetical protein PS870_00498 [Pseudomonas fluorescens]
MLMLNVRLSRHKRLPRGTGYWGAQDAIDLGDASDSDVASLKLWKQYRVALNRIEQQVGFPVTVDWPVAPG